MFEFLFSLYFFIGSNQLLQLRKEHKHLLLEMGMTKFYYLKENVSFLSSMGVIFPGQGGPNDKCYIFKMSTKGPGSGVDLVNRMRKTGQGDLTAAWIHFDYTHRIEGWATMSCSVYDPR